MRFPLRRRPFGLFLLTSLALLVCLLPTAGRADADGAGHPYFNDQGTLRWHDSFDAAKRTARREGKVIFVEYGRHACSNCRKLAENILPHPSVRARLSRVAVGLVADCDRPEREVWSLFRQRLPGARSLPFVAFLTPDGQWITGWAGYTRLGLMTTELGRAENFHVRLTRVRAAKREAAANRRAEETREPEPRDEAPVAPAPAPPIQPGCEIRKPAQDEDPCEEDDPCADGSCEYDPDGCRPRFRLPNLLGGCKPKCKPTPCRSAPEQPTRAQPEQPRPTRIEAERPAAPVIGAGSPDGDVPADGRDEPAARVPTPERRLAMGSGSPDGDVAAQGRGFPPPAAHPKLPAPEVKPATPTPATPTPEPMPVRKVRVMEPTQALAAARTAAARADWSTVLELTRTATREEHPALFALNRRAHAWAHGLLADAVRDIRARRYAEAHAAVEAVRESMRGEAESVDAERGAEAIELMRDIEPLAERSLVRRTVRKTAYEKMRGTRWAPLFSPIPQPGAAVATK